MSRDSSSIKTEIYIDGKTLRLLKFVFFIYKCTGIKLTSVYITQWVLATPTLIDTCLWISLMFEFYLCHSQLIIAACTHLYYARLLADQFWKDFSIFNFCVYKNILILWYFVYQVSCCRSIVDMCTTGIPGDVAIRILLVLHELWLYC